jgi:rhodanese-related sulfurtransferase
MSDPGIPSIQVDDIPDPVPADVVVLDVREPHEWAAGHIDGAVHIPMGEIPARVGELDPVARTLVVCHIGGRSGRVTQWLHAQGHDVTNVAGGMEAWEQAGRPTVG